MAGDSSFLPVLASPVADVLPHGFFPPVSRSAVEVLLEGYKRDAARIREIAAMAGAFFGDYLEHFLKGNLSGDNRPSSSTVKAVFSEDGALQHLRAGYWQRALALTDVLDLLPQKRRDEWNDSIREMKTPDFEDQIVYDTLRELLLSRERFFAERVDGVFRNLSVRHLTNSPGGFSERMIIANLVDSRGSTNTDRVGYINDLRCIIAKFMGRGEPRWNASNDICTKARTDRRGEWITIDGGSLRLRAYKCGTAHLEVNPEIAWRLNVVLGSLYPNAIPSQFRTKPKKVPKDFVLFGKPLPFPVLELLREAKCAYTFDHPERHWPDRGFRSIPNTLQLKRLDVDKEVYRQAAEALAALGGVKVEKGDYFEFDYDPSRVVDEIIETGVIPDQKSYQFYPTPETLASRAVLLAGIEAHHRCVEPSAGQGGIAQYMPMDRTQCLEVSALHCRILRAKGHRVAERDFLEWADEQAKAGSFHDRIVMNPPFSQGRAQLHLDAARSILAAGGRIVAILPASFRNKPAPTGWTYTWSEEIANEFADTSISVVLLVAARAAA